MKTLSYGRQFIDDDDINAVVAVLKGDWLTQGPSVEAFENAFAEYVGTRFAVAFANGTAALHGAYFAAGAKEGDKVLTSAMTFAATANAALYLGAEPVFADIDPATLCLDVRKAAEKVSGGTKIIAPVSYAGYPADISAFLELAASCDAVVVEDACHALGARRDKNFVGKEAHMTAFSFHPVKHITTGEGGMVTTDSEEFARRLRLFRTHGIEKDPRFMKSEPDGPWCTEMQILGYNYRLSDIHAALGLSQLGKIESFVSRRRRIAALYDELLQGVPSLALPPPHEGHSYHLYPLRLPAERRSFAFEELRKRGIRGMVHYPPVPLHPYYRERFGYEPGDFPCSEDLYAREISLPVFFGLSDEDVRRVSEEILRIVDFK